MQKPRERPTPHDRKRRSITVHLEIASAQPLSDLRVWFKECTISPVRAGPFTVKQVQLNVIREKK